MRCSDCSAEIRPVVAIDIDGTMAEYHGHFLDFLRSYLGVRYGTGDYAGDRGFKEWCCAAYGINEQTWHDIKLAYRQGAQKRSAPPYSSVELPEWAQRSGAEVWLTTTRPYMRLDRIDPDTRAWLARFEIPFDGLIYGDDKYQMLADRLDPERVVAVLDDLPEMYDHAAEVFGPAVPILWKQRYNTAVERPNEARNTVEARGQIYQRLARWR